MEKWLLVWLNSFKQVQTDTTKVKIKESTWAVMIYTGKMFLNGNMIYYVIYSAIVIFNHGV